MYQNLTDFMRTMESSPAQIADAVANQGFELDGLEEVKSLIQAKIDELHAYRVRLGLEGPGREGLGTEWYDWIVS